MRRHVYEVARIQAFVAQRVGRGGGLSYVHAGLGEVYVQVEGERMLRRLVQGSLQGPQRLSCRVYHTHIIRASSGATKLVDALTDIQYVRA